MRGYLQEFLVCQFACMRAMLCCSVLLDEVAPPREAPAMRGYLQEFMARPACVFQKPDVLRAVLGCLPFEDLQEHLAHHMHAMGPSPSRSQERVQSKNGTPHLELNLA
eukprot:1137182-Pelagomonas_calceolata.AAC.3